VKEVGRQLSRRLSGP